MRILTGDAAHTSRIRTVGENGPTGKAVIEGFSENVDGVFKITRIRVEYHLTTKDEKAQEARDALDVYIGSCPAARSAIRCIGIKDTPEVYA